MNMWSVTANRLVSCEMRLKEKEAEAEKLKYQLRLTRRILQHIFHEYQGLQKLKAIDVMAGENTRLDMLFDNPEQEKKTRGEKK